MKALAVAFLALLVLFLALLAVLYLPRLRALRQLEADISRLRNENSVLEQKTANYHEIMMEKITAEKRIAYLATAAPRDLDFYQVRRILQGELAAAAGTARAEIRSLGTSGKALPAGRTTNLVSVKITGDYPAVGEALLALEHAELIFFPESATMEKSRPVNKSRDVEATLNLEVCVSE